MTHVRHTSPLAGVRYPDPALRMYGLGVIAWPDAWGHTGTVENTRAMVVRRPDGVTWCVLVSGDHPESTEALRDVVSASLAEAGIPLSALSG